jgi:glycosyltransferase involved in cell wall biosynthesis
MKILMFGWEFPPHISGGLGTACFGLTTGLLQQGVDVLFVVPKLHGEEDKSKFRLLDASEVVMNFNDPWYRELLKKLHYIEVSSPILPYIQPGTFSHQASSTQYVIAPGAARSAHFDLTGHYGHDLMKEVTQYALVAAELAKQNQFDVIHAHDWLTFPAGIIAKEISGKPLIVHVHATEYDRSGENINHSVYEIERKGLIQADAVITVSEFTKEILRTRYGIPGDKITVVHNGVLPAIAKQNNAEPRAPKNEKIVTFLGRITFQKGPEYFVQAARKVLDKMPDVHFAMAGNGYMLQQIISQVAKLKMGARFHFTGFLQGQETDDIYARSDVYVMPSVSEPFGITPLEAIRSGVPVIISKQSGVSEVLKHAIKVDFWDIDALADAIAGLLRYKPLSQTFIREGSKELEDLKWVKAASKVKTIYQSVI